jgi:hypothetical protein
MKAWHVMDTAIDGEAHLLVFAETRNRARQMGFEHGTWDFEEYIHTRAKRAPAWDGLLEQERVIDTNEDLPPGAPPFYSEGEDEWDTGC